MVGFTQNSPYIELRQEPRMAFNVLSSEIHTDSDTTGPLSISLRIDTSKYPRTFYARRVTDSIVAENGKIDIAKTLSLHNDAGSLKRNAFKLGLSKVMQSRHDAVIFANNPFPTQHGVQTRNLRTEALLIHYGIDISSGAYT